MEIDGQMSIFDFIATSEFDDMTEEEMVERICFATGLKFKKVDAKDWLGVDYYSIKIKKAEICFNFDHYCDNGAKFIGVDYNTSISGHGCPCDSMDEAIKKLRTYIQWAKEGKDGCIKKGKQGT